MIDNDLGIGDCIMSALEFAEKGFLTVFKRVLIYQNIS